MLLEVQFDKTHIEVRKSFIERVLKHSLISNNSIRLKNIFLIEQSKSMLSINLSVYIKFGAPASVVLKEYVVSIQKSLLPVLSGMEIKKIKTNIVLLGFINKGQVIKRVNRKFSF